MPQHYYHRQPASRQRPSSHSSRQAYTSAYMPPRALNEVEVHPVYPGVDPYYPPFQEVEASGLVPYSPGGPGGPGGSLFGGEAPAAPPAPVTAPASSGFSLANIGELKGMIDRFGGIDGIMNGIGKMQKVVGGFQQMAPMVKLVMGMLPFGKGKNKGSAADKDYEEYSPPRSRKRRKKTTTAPRKRSSSSKPSRKSGSTRRRPKSSKKV